MSQWMVNLCNTYVMVSHHGTFTKWPFSTIISSFKVTQFFWRVFNIPGYMIRMCSEQHYEREGLFVIEVDRHCRQQGSAIIHTVSSQLFYCEILLFNSLCICIILDFLNLSVCAFVVLYGARFLIFKIFFRFLY